MSEPFTRDKTLKKNPTKVIRQFCIECMCGVLSEVANCTAPDCKLYPWRAGKNPYRTKIVLSDERREELANRMKAIRKKKEEK